MPRFAAPRLSAVRAVTPSVNRRLFNSSMCAAALAAACLALPSAAQGARGLEVSIMDDQLLINASDAKINRQMALFKRLGVDRLRVSAFWRDHAPGANSRQRPADFTPADGFDPAYDFNSLDRIVASATAAGIKVMVSISTPAPSWAAGNALGRPGLRKPSPHQFGLFAGAVAEHFAPYVDHYGISNEPNQPGWLMPQSDRQGMFAPHHYRSMVQAAYPRIKAADAESVALVGELASTGRVGSGSAKAIRPLAFLRAMACVNRSYRPVRTGRCRDFEPVPVDAIGHHPYALFSSPRRRSRPRDDAAIGDGRRLLRVLDRLTGVGALRRPGGGLLSVYYTEFGYQTNPPDPFAGIPLGRQSQYLQEAAYVSWHTPRVRGLNQFRLTDGAVYDEPGPSRYREFQSGILFADRRKKPAYTSFPHPFVVAGSRFWGQVRPEGAHTVSIQVRRGGGWRDVKEVRTDRNGYFSTDGARRGRTYRYVYDGGQSSAARAG